VVRAEPPADTTPATRSGGERPPAAAGTAATEAAPPPAAATDAAPTAPPAQQAPRPATVQRGALVEAGPGVVPPRLLDMPTPDYPLQARRAKVAGTVVLALLVDDEGRVEEVKLVRRVRENVGLNEAATDAAGKARFRPATKDGVPVKMWYTLTIPFEL
jgi:protein TonB